MENPSAIWFLLRLGAFALAMPTLFLAISRLRGNQEPTVQLAANRLAIWLAALSSFFLVVSLYAIVIYAIDPSMAGYAESPEMMVIDPSWEGNFYAPGVLLFIPALRKRAWAAAIIAGLPLLGGLMKLTVAWDLQQYLFYAAKGIVTAGALIVLVLGLLRLPEKERMEAAFVLGCCSILGFLMDFAAQGFPLDYFFYAEKFPLFALWAGCLLLVRPVRKLSWLHGPIAGVNFYATVTTGLEAMRYHY